MAVPPILPELSRRRGVVRKAGIIVSYGTIRQWCRKFGPEYARKLFERYYQVGGHGPLQIEDVQRVSDESLAGLEELRRIAGQPAATRGGGMDVLAGLHRVVATMSAGSGLRTSAMLLKGSVSLFCVLLAQALHRFEDEKRSLTLYEACLERFFAFLDAAQIIMRGSLLDADTRSRDLHRKLVASV